MGSSDLIKIGEKRLSRNKGGLDVPCGVVDNKDGHSDLRVIQRRNPYIETGSPCRDAGVVLCDS